MFLLTGCSVWVPTEGKFVSTEYRFEAELPVNWYRWHSIGDGLLLTRDGQLLDVVRIVRDPFDKELEYTKRKLSKGMLSQEVAEVIVDNLRSNRNISNFQLVENVPVDLGGYPGFKLTYTYQTKENLKKSGVYYGSLVDQWLYYLYLEAPSRHYFGRDLPAFEQTKNSLKITH